MDAVVAKGLTKRFGEFVAVNNLDLTIPIGVCFGILGPNGAGKTTTIRMIQAQSAPTAGTLTVLGLDVASQARQVKQILGVVPQENNLDPDFTVHANLTTYARFFGIPHQTAITKADELLGFVQLTDKRNQPVPALSGGMKRRLIVARALINSPDVLILDEPTTGLDPQARHTLWNLIRGLRREGKTIVLTTHYMDEAEQLCDDLVVMDQGKILERGAPKALVTKHTQGEAVEFVVGWSPDGAKVESFARALTEVGLDFEKLPDRVIAYGPKANAAADELVTTHSVPEMVRRRATLEDVFLRLTGRALRD